MADIDKPWSPARGGLSKGVLGPLARGQYSALAAMRARLFVNSFRTTSGAFELGARTVSFFIYCLMGLSLGTAAGIVAYSLVARQRWQSLSIEFWVFCVLWLAISVALVSFQEQYDLSGLLQFPVNFRVVLPAPSDLRSGRCLHHRRRLVLFWHPGGSRFRAPRPLHCEHWSLGGLCCVQHPFGTSRPCLDRSLAGEASIARDRQRALSSRDVESATSQPGRAQRRISEACGARPGLRRSKSSRDAFVAQFGRVRAGMDASRPHRGDPARGQ